MHRKIYIQKQESAMMPDRGFPQFKLCDQSRRCNLLAYLGLPGATSGTEAPKDFGTSNYLNTCACSIEGC
jgi:hypothetical protein